MIFPSCTLITECFFFFWQDTPKAVKENELKKAVLFNVSGLIGTGLFYALYEALFSVYPSASNCWALSYMISIIWQHALHRYLVFGGSGNYWSTLLWSYVVYSASIILSTVCIQILVEYLSFGHQLAWIISLLFTGVINYFAVKMGFEDKTKSS